MMSKIGLLAGRGNLPLIWARKASEKGESIFAFPLLEGVDKELEHTAEVVEPVNLGALDSLIKQLLKYDIKKVVMIGKINKTDLFDGLEMDKRMKELLAGLDQLNNDDILLAIVEELAGEGIEVISQATYIEDLFPGPGVLAGSEPDAELLKDMEFGYRMAKEIGALDIGQTVIVKNRAVLAIEAMEGSDETIRRGGKLGGPGVVMAKVSKPDQDFRFDLPTIGRTTLENLVSIKARALVVEAETTFLIDEDTLIEMAEEAGITIIAME